MLQLYDLAGIYFRAFYAVPSSITGPHGRPVNAIRGSLDILAKVIADARPTRGVACLDVDWRPAWRVDLVPSYKAHRVAVTESGKPVTGDPMGAVLGQEVDAPAGELAESVPDELSPQVPVLLAVLAAIGIPVAGAADCEADDVIGTLADRERADPVEVVSGDRDLFQLVRAEPVPVTVRYIGAGMSRVEVVDDAALRTRYRVDGAGYAAMATLRGDPSDGLPGVAGIGEKTAADLIGRFGSLDGVLAAAADPASGLSTGVRTKLAAAADYLPAAARVVLVARDADVHQEPAGDAVLPVEPVDLDGLRALVAEHGIDGPVSRLLEALAGR